jgi:hypothetical protein
MEEQRQGEIERLSFLYSEIFPLIYIGNQQIQITKQRNLQFCALCFPAVDNQLTIEGAQRTCANPYQYINWYLQTINASYGNLTAIKTPIQLTPYNSNAMHQNAIIYGMYKKICARESCKQVAPAISYEDMNQYHIYWLPFFSAYCAPHVTADSKDIRITTTATTINPAEAFVYTAKLEVVEIAPDGTVTRLDKF